MYGGAVFQLLLTIPCQQRKVFDTQHSSQILPASTETQTDS